jgi:uncharacterized membrane protein
MKNQQSQNTDSISPEIVESESLPEEANRKSNNVTLRASASIRRGPIPPSELLDEREKSLPGFADRVLDEVVNDIEHQRKVKLAEIEQEKRILEAHLEITNKVFITSMAALIFAAGSVLKGEKEVAIAFLASLAGVSAIYNKDKMQKLEQKKDNKQNILE